MKEFRRDVGDLLESVCSIVPTKLLQNLAGIVTRNIAEAEPDWPSVEAALFGLIAVADSDDDSVSVVCNDPSLLQRFPSIPLSDCERVPLPLSASLTRCMFMALVSDQL